MDFDTLYEQMRGFEQSLDRTLLQGVYIVVGLYGHGFTRLTKKEWDLEQPFDITLLHLMDCRFRINYGYTQNDEISLLFHIEDTFARKERKHLFILASEAYVAFYMKAGRFAVFDCRLISLPNINCFRWRCEDSRRNSLNGYCYRLLRHKGVLPTEAWKCVSSISISEKNEMLLNYNDLPSWQKRGVGMSFRHVEKRFNPIRGNKMYA